MIPHPQAIYNRFHYDNDIVLVGLKEPLTFTQYVGAICLPEKEIEPRQICVTAGWGYTSPGGKYCFFLNNLYLLFPLI